MFLMSAATRLPFDSIAVVARSAGGVRAAVVADILGEDLASALARSPQLRVPRPEFVRPYARSEMSAEEIGRALNVRGIALCTVASENGSIDLAVDVIDVLREELIIHDAFLVSAREIAAAGRAILRAIPGHGRAMPSTCAAIVE
ncbi:MAG TPA: hypothetical protein VG323_21620, partial [Thermoanaerobaculia bacterium]|nr:hypothetical protein [Thermoanaerobaculia bacterium]